MRTPIADFLKKYSISDFTRLHMPGHKGHCPYPPLDMISSFDITEITGADVLYEANDIIEESEKNAASLYESGSTSYSASGSSLCIQSMVSSVCVPGDTIIAARNAHSSFINTCALLDITPIWIVPSFRDEFGVSGEISLQSVEDAIAKHPEAKAVYITSPDYLGGISDISSIAKLCNKTCIPLLVDNAHGAHLKFLPHDIHPLTLGASMCCDSAHKTLPVLTGGAYIHTKKGFFVTKEQIKKSMSLFGTTSPSYLILLSLDLNNRYLFEKAREDFLNLSKNFSQLITTAQNKKLSNISDPADCTRLTFDAYSIGMTGNELAAYLRSHNIECEYTSARHVVLMFSPFNTSKDFKKIQNTLISLPSKPPLKFKNSLFTLPKSAMPLRKATFAQKIKIPIDIALNRISGETKIKCPPGIPMVVAGEIIDHDLQKLLKKSGISYINVIK